MILDAHGNDATRADGWQNATTGVGYGLRTKALDFAPDARLPDGFLEQLYIGDPYLSRICRVVPREALRQGFRVKLGDPTAEGGVAAKMKALQAPVRLRAAWTWARVFGGGAVFVGADDGLHPSLPLDRGAIRSVRFLITLDRRELIPQRWYSDSLTPEYGTPETYLLQRQGQSGVERAVVHESRLIRFEGLLSTRNRQMNLSGWGESELQRIYSVMQKFNGGWEAVGTLLQESSIGVLQMEQLAASMAADKNDTFKRRMQMMDLSKSVAGSLLIAKDEQFSRTEVGSLTGIADVLDKFLLLLSGAAEIPVTILMGQSPAGLSATGDSDVRWFYDRIKSDQTEILQPALERLVDLILLAKDGPTRGVLPAERSVEFAPLWQMTPLEQADLRQKVATADAAYVTANIVTPEEVALSRFRPEGWSMETTVDLDARRAAQAADAAADAEVNATAPGADHAEGVIAIVAKVAAREIPRDAGVALLQSSMGLGADQAEAVMGAAGRTYFTAPEPSHAAAMEAIRSENAKLKASNEGHKAYTARLVQKAKDGGLELGAFTSQAPTETAEGDQLAEGDVVAVPAVQAEGGEGP